MGTALELGRLGCCEPGALDVKMASNCGSVFSKLLSLLNQYRAEAGIFLHGAYRLPSGVASATPPKAGLLGSGARSVLTVRPR